MDAAGRSRHRRPGRTARAIRAGTRCCSKRVLGTLALFYKVGPRPTTWWGMVRTSRDNGRTWSEARRLPDGVLGPVKNKPVRLDDGTLISGSSTETPDAANAWRVHFERSTDNGETWTIVRPAPGAPAARRSARSSRASWFTRTAGCRRWDARDRSDVFETWSSDKGKTWTSGDADVAAESERRHRRRHAPRRPSFDRLQPHAQRTHRR